MSREFRVVEFGSVSSTQDELRYRARAGEDVARLCVRAATQTGGRGRRGTGWLSPVGGSYQSVGLGREAPPWLTPALGVGIAGSLNRLTDSPRVLVKWPNDLYLGEGKLGGILTEVVSQQVVVGVGVNVSNEVPPGAARLAGREVSEVSDAVLAGLSSGVRLAKEGGEAVATAFAAVDFLFGRVVEVVTGALEPANEAPIGERTSSRGDAVSGVARGIDAQGALIVEVEAAGAILRLGAGHVVGFGSQRIGSGSQAAT